MCTNLWVSSYFSFEQLQSYDQKSSKLMNSTLFVWNTVVVVILLGTASVTIIIVLLICGCFYSSTLYAYIYTSR